LIIPFEQLSEDAVQGLIEEFITREGTDYGDVERSLSEKVEDIRNQLLAKEIVIVFDPYLESVSLQPRLQAQEQERKMLEGNNP
jgi:uncharacterized protein